MKEEGARAYLGLRNGLQRQIVDIALLADHLDCIPTLARWFKKEWPDYYARQTFDEIEQDFHHEANRTSLPLGLIAFEGATLVGTIVLREKALRTLPQYTPGLGGLYVAPPHRRRGIGSRLVTAGMEAARSLNYRTLYTATSTAGGLLDRLGWDRAETIVHNREELGLYRCAL